MLDRIRDIISARKLSPTQFADTIGISRPIVSHILSGRNKPSLEVVQKIVAAFPDVSLPWLLSGVGPMYDTIALKASESTPHAPTSPPIGTRVQKKADVAVKPVKQPAFIPQNTPELFKPGEEEHLTPLAAVVNNPTPAALDVTDLPKQEQPASSHSNLTTPLPESNKKIKRIVIFYQDGTFSDFQPE